jgi:hypothetical protein
MTTQLSADVPDDPFVKAYGILQGEGNLRAAVYMYEVACVQAECMHLLAGGQKRRAKYYEDYSLGMPWTSGDEKMFDSIILIGDLIYRFFALTEKMAQLSNAVLGLGLDEEYAGDSSTACSFRNVKKSLVATKHDLASEFKAVLKRSEAVIAERKRMTHTALYCEAIPVFTSHALPFFKEVDVTFIDWLSHSLGVMSEAISEVDGLVDLIVTQVNTGVREGG